MGKGFESFIKGLKDYQQQRKADRDTTDTVVRGIRLILSLTAFIVSYALNHSVLWAVFHMLCGWLYFLYAVVGYGPQIIPSVQQLFGL
jgi:hypothetical protein